MWIKMILKNLSGNSSEPAALLLVWKIASFISSSKIYVKLNLELHTGRSFNTILFSLVLFLRKKLFKDSAEIWCNKWFWSDLCFDLLVIPNEWIMFQRLFISFANLYFSENLSCLEILICFFTFLFILRQVICHSLARFSPI